MQLAQQFLSFQGTRESFWRLWPPTQSHSSQSMLQFFLATNSIANITPISSANKEFWFLKFKVKQPKAQALSFLKIPRQPADHGLPLAALSILHLVHPWIKRFQLTCLMIWLFLGWPWIPRDLKKTKSNMELFMTDLVALLVMHSLAKIRAMDINRIVAESFGVSAMPNYTNYKDNGNSWIKLREIQNRGFINADV